MWPPPLMALGVVYDVYSATVLERVWNLQPSCCPQFPWPIPFGPVSTTVGGASRSALPVLSVSDEMRQTDGLITGGLEAGGVF